MPSRARTTRHAPTRRQGPAGFALDRKLGSRVLMGRPFVLFRSGKRGRILGSALTGPQSSQNYKTVRFHFSRFAATHCRDVDYISVIAGFRYWECALLP